MTAAAASTRAEIERRARGGIAALQGAGVTVGKVRVLPDGTVEVYAGSGGDESGRLNPLDRLLD